MSTLSEPRRPRLLAQNRKLRHLKGLWLRNLSFVPPNLRTTDDALVGSSGIGIGSAGGASSRLRRPSRLEAVHESTGDQTSSRLQQSRSSENLRTGGLGGPHAAATTAASSEALALRPLPRRRSLSIGSLSQNTPASRQKVLEELADTSVGDAFFSLHVDGQDEPVYVSEVRHRSTNFNFSFFDLGDEAAHISRACQLTIRVWARRPKGAAWLFIMEEAMDLRRLNFIGTLLNRRFPENALVFHLEDGVYSVDFPNRVSEPRQAPPPMATPPFNTLMKLANLESSIDDAVETRVRIMRQINQILESVPPDRSDAADDQAKLAERYVAWQQKANRFARRRRDDLHSSLRSRREAIARGRELEARAARDMADSRSKLVTDADLAEQTQREIHGQRRRICSDLCDIFPITPVPDAPPLSFEICGVPLPNSVYDAATARSLNEDVLSAALGLVALAVHRLQFYLGCPLPYPVNPLGSRSHIRDDISQLAEHGASPRRDFPLHLPRGGSTTNQWRFEYGWFLLNKDIEALCAAQGLRVVDIRQTLPNLKYLLYVCSAGSDQVPERKKGGVRGLWRGRLDDTSIRHHRHSPSSPVPSSPSASLLSPTETSTTAVSLDGGGSSPRGSIDSDMISQNGDAVRNALLAPGLPFAQGDAKFTLRTSGLRENVV
ncbi:UV radiation resistance-associated protein [Geosmithia morbida]|uniref:Autophagy-related protein 14 n=1 Tax=Geosmithia morbida TaxID=1094350 RepID=A0A9P5D6K9_9HYPO|nr:UV radiation resistance-associated protein [Geosmithia morbida]KAF4124865.1 UV radiation resistance-associated protein [Geosmithia morbida]